MSSELSPQEQKRTRSVQQYWNAHPLGTQFGVDPQIQVGTSEFFDHIRPQMTARFPWIVDLIRRWGPELRGQRMLEVGCGMGFDTLEWHRQGVNITAIDLSSESVDLARLHMQHMGANPEISVGSALELPFDDESFDAVYSRGVLHHTGDTPRAIEEVRRVLRPGGRAFICHLYRRYSWMYFISKLGREPIEFVDGDPPVTDFYTVPEVRRMFEKFRSVEIELQHYRALKTLRRGTKATLYNGVFRPAFNLLPTFVARPLAYKVSAYAVR